MITITQEQLKEKNYYIDKASLSLINAALNCSPARGAILEGAPGAGKSSLAKAIADILHAEYLQFQFFPGSREDDLFLRLIPDSKTKSGIKAYPGILTQAARLAKKGKHVVVLLDEFDKARPSADSFLLLFLQEGKIRFAGIEEDADLGKICIFITSNKERDLSPYLLRRLPRIFLKAPSAALAAEILKSYGYEDHPFFHHAIAIYEIAMQTDLEKPVTLQEIRQFLDALSLLGESADFDDLLKAFVLKDSEDFYKVLYALKQKNHFLKKFSSPSPKESFSDSFSSIFDNKIEEMKKAAALSSQEEGEGEKKPRLPRPLSPLQFQSLPESAAPESASDDSSAAVFSSNEFTYDSLSKIAILEEKEIINEYKFESVFISRDISRYEDKIVYPRDEKILKILLDNKGRKKGEVEIIFEDISIKVIKYLISLNPQKYFVRKLSQTEVIFDIKYEDYHVECFCDNKALYMIYNLEKGHMPYILDNISQLYKEIDLLRKIGIIPNKKLRNSVAKKGLIKLVRLENSTPPDSIGFEYKYRDDNNYSMSIMMLTKDNLYVTVSSFFDKLDTKTYENSVFSYISTYPYSCVNLYLLKGMSIYDKLVIFRKLLADFLKILRKNGIKFHIEREGRINGRSS
jgi:MoxR-like ATPase